MATKKKDGKKEAAKNQEVEEVTYRDMCSEEQLFSQWRVSESIIELLLDGAVNIVKDKEIAKKIPAFSLVSTVMTIKKAINMRSYKSDPREDDIYIDAEEGEEMLPPPDDNCGKKRKLNVPEIVEQKHQKKMMISQRSWFNVTPIRGSGLTGRRSQLSAKSRDSNRSKDSKRSTAKQGHTDSFREIQSPSKRPTKRKRGDSEQRKRME
mmetsp:Transcript_24476/g.30495  ORF Transcript_24476/g.30495 Transcript_24476/m.30495 type:complete len:208 (+) Transcript_24476:41-664(+)